MWKRSDIVIKNCMCKLLRWNFTLYLWKPKGKEFFHSLVESVVSESDKQTARHKLFQKTNNLVKFNTKIRYIPFGWVGNGYDHFYKEDFGCC